MKEKITIELSQITIKRLRKAIRIAECVAVDYSGMSNDEVNDLDASLDLIFKIARLIAKEGDNNAI